MIKKNINSQTQNMEYPGIRERYIHIFIAKYLYWINLYFQAYSSEINRTIAQ